MHLDTIFLLLVGIALIIIGVTNIKGNISTVRWYHRLNVSASDAPKYGRVMGIGTVVMGASVILTAVLHLIFARESVFYVAMAGVTAGLILILYAQFKYNKGLF